MVYHALECVDDAIEATRDFLLPVDRGRWLKLAVVVFFLSGGSGASSAPNVSTSFGPDEFPQGNVPPSELLDQFLPLVVGLVIVFALVGVAFMLVGSLMEFVLVDSLRTESVNVRTSMREHLSGGLALFAFRLLLWVGVLGLLAGLASLLVLPALGNDTQVLAGALVVVLAGVVVGFPAALVHGLTTEFVVPTMIHENRGLRSAWRRFWPVLRGNLVQFVVYVVVRFALMLGVAFVAGIATGIVGAILAVPFFLVGGVAWLGFGGSLSVASAIVFGLVVAVYVLVLLALTAVVQVPLKTFTRYYELLVLGDIEPDLDLITERREAVRGDGLQTQ